MFSEIKVRKTQSFIYLFRQFTNVLLNVVQGGQDPFQMIAHTPEKYSQHFEEPEKRLYVAVLKLKHVNRYIH
jgi:hypothetical protein